MDGGVRGLVSARINLDNMEWPKMTFRMIAGIAVLAFLVPAHGEESTTSVRASFAVCVKAQANVVAQYKVQPDKVIPISNNSSVAITKICTGDGSVLVTCGKTEEKMVITQSDKRC